MKKIHVASWIAAEKSLCRPLFTWASTTSLTGSERVTLCLRMQPTYAIPGSVPRQNASSAGAPCSTFVPCPGRGSVNPRTAVERNSSPARIDLRVALGTVAAPQKPQLQPVNRVKSSGVSSERSAVPDFVINPPSVRIRVMRGHSNRRLQDESRGIRGLNRCF